ncbi:MAG: hypothetical protein ACI4JB_10185 [Porcipelethomonas sp.]
MKFRKIFAVLLASSMLVCLSACGSNEESSTLEKEIRTETLPVETTETAESEISDVESEVEDEAGSTDISSIAKLYDPENPQETVIAILEQGFQASFSDNMKIEYDEKEKNYTLSVWQDGFDAALGTEAGTEALNSMSSKITSSLDTMTTQIRTLDTGANITFNFISDKDQSTPLITIYNGDITYNITEE